METLTKKLPQACTAKGDLLIEAERMLDAGYVVSAVVTARVAIERAVFDITVQACVYARPFTGTGSMSHDLKVNKVFGERLHRDTVQLNADLSQVAHGRRITITDAAGLLRRATKLRKRHRKLQAELKPGW